MRAHAHHGSTVWHVGTIWENNSKITGGEKERDEAISRDKNMNMEKWPGV
jgi:hypothetical protein